MNITDLHVGAEVMSLQSLSARKNNVRIPYGAWGKIVSIRKYSMAPTIFDVDFEIDFGLTSRATYELCESLSELLILVPEVEIVT